jgi:hypothetical protein
LSLIAIPFRSRSATTAQLTVAMLPVAGPTAAALAELFGG